MDNSFLIPLQCFGEFLKKVFKRVSPFRDSRTFSSQWLIEPGQPWVWGVTRPTKGEGGRLVASGWLRTEDRGPSSLKSFIDFMFTNPIALCLSPLLWTTHYSLVISVKRWPFQNSKPGAGGRMTMVRWRWRLWSARGLHVQCYHVTLNKQICDCVTTRTHVYSARVVISYLVHRLELWLPSTIADCFILSLVIRVSCHADG